MLEPSRFKNPDLAAQIDEGHLAWHRQITPLTEYYAHKIGKQDFRGKRLAYWGHVTGQNLITMIMPLKQAGAEIVIGACNVDSTDDAAAAYVASKGVHVYAWQGMSQADYRENLAIVRSFDADYLCDMGGELCEAYLDKTPPVKAAMEATTSGLHLLNKYKLPFPVFDWNSIPLKNLHNRYHVGDTIWPAFNHLTQMSLYGRRVFVIGCGPVGKGIAERARAIGAVVSIMDVDPVRLLEARHLGCEVMSLEQGLARNQIIVTATGVEGILRKDHLSRVRPGAILFNAGHSNREIDIDWLYQQPHQRLRPHIERFDLGDTHLFLLGQGSLLNLSAGSGPFGADQFDHYTAVMLVGIAWMFNGMPADTKTGLQRFPIHLEQEIAQRSIELLDRI